MAQPPAYERAEDFTQRDGNDTNHAAINAELDNAATSINRTRENLAKIQRDDGGLVAGIVDAAALSDSAFERVMGRVNDAAITADTAANSSLYYSQQASNSAATAVAAATTAQTQANQVVQAATSAQASATAAASSASLATNKATAADSAATAAGTYASTAQTDANSAQTYATSAQNSATTATTQAGNAATSATAAANRATDAAASASAAATSATQAASSMTAAATSATNAAASAAAAEAAAQTASNALESTASNIQMDGVQSAGALSTAARGDHRHPTDTTRAPLVSPSFTGVPTAPTAAPGTNTEQLATTAFAMTAASNAVAGMTIAAASETVAGKIEIATSAEAIAGTDTARAITPAGLRSALNASGSAPVYACRAWVNFNGTNTVAIRSSGNVSSITDNGVGSYTINFIDALPDSNYAAVAQVYLSSNNATQFRTKTPTTTALTLSGLVNQSGTANDASNIDVAIFR